MKISWAFSWDDCVTDVLFVVRIEPSLDLLHNHYKKTRSHSLFDGAVNVCCRNASPQSNVNNDKGSQNSIQLLMPRFIADFDIVHMLGN